MANDTIEKMLIPLINEKANKQNELKCKKMVNAFIDKNNEALFHPTPAYRLVFQDGQREKLFDCYNVDSGHIKKIMGIIDRDKSVRKPIGYNYVGTKPFNIFSAALIKYYMIKKDKEMLSTTMMNLIFSFYALSHAKYYRYIPNPNIMEYTINRINNKFLFKQYGSVIKVLQHAVAVNHEAMKDGLLKDGDQGLLEYLSSLNSRLNNQMNLFASEFYKDQEEKNIIFKQADDYSEGNYTLTTNLSMDISSKAEGATHEFFSTRINEKRAELAAKACSVDPNVLKDAIGNIRQKDPDLIKQVIINIMMTYMNDPRNNSKELGSQKFVGECIRIYSKSNIKVQSVIDLKKLLDEMLNIACSRYHDTTRENTKSNYRKALFVYLVLMIQQSVK